MEKIVFKSRRNSVIYNLMTKRCLAFTGLYLIYGFRLSRRRKNAGQHGHGPVNTNGSQGARGPGQTLRERERGVAQRKRRAVQL